MFFVFFLTSLTQDQVYADTLMSPTIRHGALRWTPMMNGHWWSAMDTNDVLQWVNDWMDTTCADIEDPCATRLFMLGLLCIDWACPCMLCFCKVVTMISGSVEGSQTADIVTPANASS